MSEPVISADRHTGPERSESCSAVLDGFSFIHGGPIYRFERLLRVAGPANQRVLKRALVAISLTWAPLLILSLIEHQAFGTSVRIPFLYDFAVNIRFLIALPLLIVAEKIIDPRLRHTVEHFVTSGMVTAKELPAYQRIIAAAARLRDARLPATLLAVAALAPSIWLEGNDVIGPSAPSWHSVYRSSGVTQSLAGWWSAAISLPLYRLMLMRWLWVIILWAIFLHRVSKLDLHCPASHPDGAGGFGFLTDVQIVFGIVVFAASSVVASGFGNALAYGGKTLPQLQVLMITFCALLVVLFTLPLLVVTPKLIEIRERGLFEYHAMGSAVAQGFDRKWLEGSPLAGEGLLGVQDISSMADLYSTVGIVRDMKVVLLDRRVLLGLAIPAVLPMLVVVAIATPVQQWVGAVLKLLA